MPKTIWLIDGAYLLKSSAAHGKFDYIKLKNELEEINGGEFKEIYYLNSVKDSSAAQQNAFHNWLKSAPPTGPKMRVKLYGLKEMSVRCGECGQTTARPVQKGVDVGIATLIIKLASQNQYDRLLLSAGDGDFEDAIDYVKSELHKEIWLAGFSGNVSPDLQSYADKVIWLEKHWDRIGMGNSPVADETE
ncbi:NYN domain-containing protein [Hymenobacter koreensis]|uniref:NYN domain-containing protein n=1 Tax=Hymenobacter koreensis TaxID=1084523 RepID=A0ABP8IUE3_9BACT